MYKALNFLIIFLIASCASGHRKQQNEIRKQYKVKNYKKAAEIIKADGLAKDSDSKLLYKMELASTLFAEEKYEKAIKLLHQAKELMDKYFTKSVVKSIATNTLLNSNFEKYRGAFYEKSYVHYLLVASYYNVYLRGSVYKQIKKEKKREFVLSDISNTKKKKYLYRARAEVLAWDTFFEDVKATFKSKTTYHYDLLVKLYGGLIHEEIGTRKELNISLILYQNAYKILNTLYPSHSTYNEKSNEFFEKVQSKKLKLTSKKQDSKLFKPTSDFLELEKYLKYKILSIAYQYSKSKYRVLKKRYSLGESQYKEIESKLPIVNLTINQGLIPEKKPKTVSLGLIGMMEGIEDDSTKKLVMGIGIPILTAFAMNELGLYPRRRYLSRGEFRAYNNLFKVTAKSMAIEYEVPIVEKFTNNSKYSIHFKQAGKLIKKISVSKIASLGDFAVSELKDTARPRLIKKASRVALKHLAAIATVYATYKGMSSSNKKKRRRKKARGLRRFRRRSYSSSGSAFAKIAAVAQYALLAKGIKESEKADVRYWSTIPKNVFQTETRLNEGQYQVELVKEGKKAISYSIGTVAIESGKNFFTYHRPDIP